MKSIYGKLISGFLITVILSFSIAGYITIRNNSSQIEQMATRDLLVAHDYIINLLNDSNIKNQPDLLQHYSDSANINITLYSENQPMITYGNEKLAPSIDYIKVLYDQVSHEDHISSSNNVQSFGRKYNNINGVDYYLYLQKDVSADENIIMNSIYLILLCVFISGSFVFLVVAEIIVNPIRKLTNATSELAKGNYDVRVNYTGNDEMSRLNHSFNQMAVQLRKQEETRQKFISDISHEFQTPLTAIQGFANILKEEELPQSQKQKYADIILFHSKRLSTLSKNMLQLTLLDREDVELEYTTYSLIEQINRVISTQEYQADQKNIEIVFQKPKRDIMVTFDEPRMEQVWTNILSNAIKYTGEDGLITITIKRSFSDIEVSIEDTGMGMSKEVVSHIFERFYREDKARNQEGNGLGLAIVKSIIDLHQGSIDVISDVDVGTTFIIKLPIEHAGFNLKEKLPF